MTTDIDAQSQTLVTVAAAITAASGNEENLRAELEKRLEVACEELGITWTPYQLDRTLVRADKKVRFVDVAHGAVVIEYESPNSFKGGGAQEWIKHAREQAEEYAELLSVEEGRSLGDYVHIAWDGAHITFGRRKGDEGVHWETLTPFNNAAAKRLLTHLADDGVPLVHPHLLSQLVGPRSSLGAQLLPKLFAAVEGAVAVDAGTTKTHLLYTEWRRLFGQVIGVQSDQLQALLAEQGRSHGVAYEEDVPAYLFALNTYIALVAKLVAGMALPNAAQNILDPASPIQDRIRALEDGELFADAGIENMLNGDFFAWYSDDQHWPDYEEEVDALVNALRGVSFDLSVKSPESTRDLFKGLYMEFVPAALRHALGEYYTPDWLAAHALDEMGWTTEDPLGDPTCGSGTFLLEALKRRLAEADPNADAQSILAGLWGFDLNPLAVLAARSSVVVYLADRLDPAHPVRLPIFLADAINPAEANGKAYHHSLLTEKGELTFEVPIALVERDDFFQLMGIARDWIDAGVNAADIYERLATCFDLSDLEADEASAFQESLTTLERLHAEGWNGIWCSILAERFAAGSVGKSTFIAGNPPWVKWSHLPSKYASFIKARCDELGVFSDDVWVGGIESDISTVITYEAVEKYLADRGQLGFFITGTVFANESSQGFRRWRLADTGTSMEVKSVEDYAAVKPFEGVSNHATFLRLEKGKSTQYPVRYRVWKPPSSPHAPRRYKREFATSAEFREEATYTDLEARPVPGSDAGPWLKGTAAQHEVWSHVFSSDEPAFKARKGVTTDANGIFFVRVTASSVGGEVNVENEPKMGRRPIPTVKKRVEEEHLFPLLRGEGVSAFEANPDNTFRIMMPQRGMHGNQDLATQSPKTYKFLKKFKSTLEARSSYRRFQQRAGAPWWSLWSTGAYTFAPFKVVWREMSGGRFEAAYVGDYVDPVLGQKRVIPDHKVYFVPCESEYEAAYLTGFLNAPIVSAAISAYAAQLSLGVSVVEYLAIPEFDATDHSHVELAEKARQITERRSVLDADWKELDRLVAHLTDLPAGVLARAHKDEDDEEVQEAEALASE